MMKMAGIVASLGVVFALITPVTLAKHATVGIYAVVEKVEFEPDEISPQRIRIHGIFVVPVPMSSGHYQSPERGYLYFRIAPEMEQQARQEWAELKALSGTGRVVGFGQYWKANPADPSGNPHQSLRVEVYRDSDEAVPDIYPQPHAGGVIERGEKADPESENIMGRLEEAARR